MRAFKKLRDRSSDERGQIVMVAAFALVVALGFAALAVDVGQFLQTRTKLQADVDAMALGGAKSLCGTAECSTTAKTEAEKLRAPNKLSAAEGEADINLTCQNTSITDNDMVTARATRYNSSLIAQVVGFFGTDISACATAGKFALGGANGVVPFGIEESCLNEGEYGEPYTLKYDSDTETANGLCEKTGGNFAALAIDASGAGPGCNSGPIDDEELKFRRALCFGANRGLCVINATVCNGEADDDKCAGQNVAAWEICTETGNMVGPTQSGIEHRFAYTHQSCDEWEEVANQPPSLPGIKTNCDPWVPGGPSSLRVIMIPIVNGLFGEKGTHKVTIVGFAVFFLESNTNCRSGNDCDIQGRFIQTQMHTGGLGYAPLDPNSSVTIVRLLE